MEVDRRTRGARTTWGSLCLPVYVGVFGVGRGISSLDCLPQKDGAGAWSLGSTLASPCSTRRVPRPRPPPSVLLFHGLKRDRY